MSNPANWKQEDLIVELSIWNIQRSNELSENAERDTLNANYDTHDKYATYFNYVIRRLLPPRGNRFRHDHHDTCMYIERSKNANVVTYTANLLNKQTQQRVESGASSGALCECVFDEHNPIHAYFLKIDEQCIRERRKQGINYDHEELNMIERKFAYGCNVSQLSSEVVVRRALHKSDKFQTFVQSLIKQENNISKTISVDELIEQTVQWWSNWQPHVMNFVALPHHHTLLLCLPPLNEVKIEMCSKLQHSMDEQHNGTILHKLNQQKGNTTDECISFTDTVVVVLTMINGAPCVMDHAFVKSAEPKHFYQLPSVEYVELHGISLNSFEPAYVKIVK